MSKQDTSRKDGNGAKRKDAKNAAQDEYALFPCDVCGSTQTIELPRVREYTGGQVLHICKKCGLIYANKRRSYERIADAWSNELFGDPKILSAHNYSAKNPHVKARQTYFLEFLDVHLGLKGKDVCDIGAGEGPFLDMVRAAGGKVFGIEPSKKNDLLLSTLKIPHFVGTVEEYGDHAKKTKDPYRADIVTMIFTLECSQSPRKMLEIAHRTLKDGGSVSIETGSRILVPFKKPLHTFLSTTPVDTHPIDFSFNTLKALLSQVGFEVTHVNPYIENDLLCVIAKKVSDGRKIAWHGDDYMKVVDFFERWHTESLHYR